MFKIIKFVYFQEGRAPRITRIIFDNLRSFFWKFWVCLCKTMERKSVRVVHWSFRSFVGRGVGGWYWIPGMSFLKVFHKSWSDFGNVKIVFFHYLWLEVVTVVEVRSHRRKRQYSIENHWIIHDQNESVHKFTQKQKLRKLKIRKNTCVFGTNSAKINCLYQCKITEVKIKDILITLNQIFEKIFCSMKMRFKQN